ncbi:MAG: hypothetical protein JO244_10465, partial [Solirubrobacterales bacterium]|nr:hypothetical protein [Solirubrobacterales bacterium]
PYSDHHHHYHAGWLAFMVGLGAVAIAASVYLVYVLEILKFKSFRTRELRQADPATSEHEIEERVARELETGEFERVQLPVADGGPPGASDRGPADAARPRAPAPPPTAGRPR